MGLFFTFNFLMLFVFVTLLTFLIKRRNYQPLKKKSPRLVLASVIGHFLVFFNITIMGSYFELVWEKQSSCYFANNHYQPSTVAEGDQCFKTWYQNLQIRSFQSYSQLNAFAIQMISENLALFPYLLRSLRIQKIF